MTNADVWECALAEGWKPGTGNSVRDAVAFLAKHGHKLYEITPPNDPSSVTRRPGADDNQKPL